MGTITRSSSVSLRPTLLCGNRYGNVELFQSYSSVQSINVVAEKLLITHPSVKADPFYRRRTDTNNERNFKKKRGIL